LKRKKFSGTALQSASCASSIVSACSAFFLTARRWVFAEAIRTPCRRTVGVNAKDLIKTETRRSSWLRFPQ